MTKNKFGDKITCEICDEGTPEGYIHIKFGDCHGYWNGCNCNYCLRSEEIEADIPLPDTKTFHETGYHGLIKI